MAGTGTIALDIDTRAFRKLGEYQKQIPFVISLTLNNLARDAQTVVKSELDHDFKIRSPWTARSIRVQNSNKRDLKAVVGSISPYMVEQALGKQEDGESWVPTVGKDKPRTRPLAKTGKKRWPSASMWTKGDKTTFVGQPWKNSKSPALWQRSGGGLTKKGKRQKKRLKLLYIVTQGGADMKKWPLPEHVIRTVDEMLEPRLGEAMDQAIRTAKNKK